MAMPSTPSAAPRRRMVSRASPSASASRTASATIASRDSSPRIRSLYNVNLALYTVKHGGEVRDRRAPGGRGPRGVRAAVRSGCGAGRGRGGGRASRVPRAVGGGAVAADRLDGAGQPARQAPGVATAARRARARRRRTGAGGGTGHRAGAGRGGPPVAARPGGRRRPVAPRRPGRQLPRSPAGQRGRGRGGGAGRGARRGHAVAAVPRRHLRGRPGQPGGAQPAGGGAGPGGGGGGGGGG